VRSTDAGIDELPLYIRRAFGVSREWMARSLCRDRRSGVVAKAWTIEETESLDIGGSVHAGRKLVQMALEVCARCPVQWECTEYAIETDACAGTWGVRLSDVRFLSRRPLWKSELRAARREGVPVQTLASLLRAHDRMSP
jgi:hypothetical protein